MREDRPREAIDDSLVTAGRSTRRTEVEEGLQWIKGGRARRGLDDHQKC